MSELRAMARPMVPSETAHRWLLGLVLGLGTVELAVLGGALAYFYL